MVFHFTYKQQLWLEEEALEIAILNLWYSERDVIRLEEVREKLKTI